MSAATSPPPAPATIADSGAPDLLARVNATAPAPETCPLCGAPLHGEQEWCLRCGAAARTRLATSSNWKAPIIAIAVVVALSLGVLGAALVKLAGTFDATRTPATTVTTAPTAVIPTTTGATPGAGTPSTTTPGATPGATGSPGGATPGASTTAPGRAGTPTAPVLASPGASTPLSQAVREELQRRLKELRRSESPAAEQQARELEQRLHGGK